MNFQVLLLLFSTPIASILQKKNEELWTNGRTDCVLVCWHQSVLERTNFSRCQGDDVLVENSSADPLHNALDWFLFDLLVQLLTILAVGKYVSYLLRVFWKSRKAILWNDEHYSHCLNRIPPCNEGIFWWWTYKHWKFWFNEVWLGSAPGSGELCWLKGAKPDSQMDVAYTSCRGVCFWMGLLLTFGRRCSLGASRFRFGQSVIPG